MKLYGKDEYFMLSVNTNQKTSTSSLREELKERWILHAFREVLDAFHEVLDAFREVLDFYREVFDAFREVIE